MFPHTGRVVLVSLAVLLVLSSILAQTVPGTASSPPLATAAQNSAGQTLADAFKSLDGEKFDVAREGFALALKQAIDDNNRAAEGEAHRGLGIVFYRQDRYPSARTELQEALAIFTELGDKYRIAKVRQHMGSVALMMGNQNEARELYRSALETYEQAGARADKARLLDNYAFLNISIEEKLQAIGEALEISRELGEKKLEGHCLHHRGDINFGVGNYVDAAEDYDRAVVLFKEVNARENLSRAFMSLGRLQRAHGHLDTAMPYYQEALKIQTEIGDRQGAIQSLNGIAVTLSLQGDFDQAIQYYEPALAIARSTGSPRLVGFIVGNLAALYTHNTQYDRAVEVLEELIRQTTTGDLLAQRYFQLGQTYRLMGRLQDGLQAVQMSLEQVRKQQNVDLLLKVLQERAVIWQRLGNQSNALDDIQETMQILEQLRTKLVPSDYLKRGFAEQHQALFSFAIESLWHNRRYDEALAVAEQGRARALLDLLASRDPQSNAAADMSSQAGRSAHPDAQADLPSLLALLRSQSVLPSTASEHAVTVDDIGAIARQLHSTILEYWTTTDATYLWVVGPDGQIRARRLALNSKQLERQIAQLWGIQHEETPVKLAANSNINKLGNSRIALTMRGGRIVFRSDEVNIWRRLYDELIRPVATWLPKASGSLISVVPHGPLFQLPFAGLNDGKSYLVERYSTHYAPSISVLRFTASRKRRGNSDSALLVGDPDLPTTLRKQGLPSLPSARREVELVRASLNQQSKVLVGAAASKGNVQQLLAGKKVFHIATHGIISDDDPMQSFLALASSPGSQDDGRLTAREIYGLKLDADLVFLSACRTGLGRLSGDGVNGLTRPFLYAGASTVIATLSEVADEPSYLLVQSFYRSWLHSHRAADALRSAQLRLLNDLREHKVLTRQSSGPVQLPETPRLWAGFIVVGAPR